MPYEVKVVKGFLIPSPDAAREVVKKLRSAVKSDTVLRASFEKNPRKVLANRGLTPEYQNEFLSEMGRRVSAAAECGCTGCCATSSFCCETV
jgi:hypothetical protein